MINYLVSGRYTHTMVRFLAEAAPELASAVTVVPYERLLESPTLQAGPCIFADVDILGPGLRMVARALHSRLEGCDGFSILNHPALSLGKSSLLRMLHGQGINRHAVYGFRDNMATVTFPVFLRYMNDHGGPRSPLLHTHGELRGALRRQWLKGRARKVMIVEYTDTSDSRGIFRKYAAFKVGERIIARHMLAGRSWCLKQPERTMLDPRLVEEEWSYVRDNPHEQQLEAIFSAAAIDYGRIDYGMLDGRPQAWEINTNPMILSRENLEVKERRPAQELFLERMKRALLSLDPLREGGVRFAASGKLRFRIRFSQIPLIGRHLSTAE
jgi:hypothetical protein